MRKKVYTTDQRKSLFKRNESGFTLIELIIVIAILAVIAAIAVPNLLNSIVEARKRTDVNNAQLIADTIARVYASNDAYAGVEVGYVSGTESPIAFGSANSILDNARVLFQSNPKVKYGNLAGNDFFVSVNSTGFIKVYAGSAVASEVFPNAESPY